MSSSTLNNMKSLVRATIDDFNNWDYAALRATRSDDFIYQFLPRTLNEPARNNDEYAEFWRARLTPLFNSFTATPVSITHDEDARRSVMFADVDVEAVLGPQSLEIVMMLSFNEAGDRITRIDEFFDSLTYSVFFAKVAEMQGEMAKNC